MKKLLIVVDAQNDFMNEDGKLYVNGAEEIKPNIEKLLDVVYSDNNPFSHVFYTLDYHIEGDEELSDEPDFKKTFPPHCMAGTDGVFLIDEVNVDEYLKFYDDTPFRLKNGKISHKIVTDNCSFYSFKKNKFSVFEGNEDFLEVLKYIEYVNEIYIMGVSGEICVYHAVEGLLKHKGDGFDFNRLFIIEDAIASINPETFENYLKEINETHLFIKFRSVNEVIESI